MFTHRLLKLVSVSVLLTLVFASLSTAPAWAGSTVANAGFETDNDVTTAPVGWTATGTPGASFTEWGGKRTLWYPDRKYYLLGKYITDEWLADMAPAK